MLQGYVGRYSTNYMRIFYLSLALPRPPHKCFSMISCAAKAITTALEHTTNFPNDSMMTSSRQWVVRVLRRQILLARSIGLTSLAPPLQRLRCIVPLGKGTPSSSNSAESAHGYSHITFFPKMERLMFGEQLNLHICDSYALVSSMSKSAPYSEKSWICSRVIQTC